jgi:hypothetical protein
MRGLGGRRQHQSTGKYTRSQVLLVALALAGCLLVAACGSPSGPQLDLPGGTYSSAAYGFHVTYPRNWQANPSPSTPAPGGTPTAIPFSLTITRTGDSHTAASLISTCTITVLNMKNKIIAESAAGLAKNKALQTATIGGAPGFKSSPLTQDVPNSDISVTHVDYYIIHGGYEYQISTDSVKGDDADADLRSIVDSFAFGG